MLRNKCSTCVRQAWQCETTWASMLDCNVRQHSVNCRYFHMAHTWKVAYTVIAKDIIVFLIVGLCDNFDRISLSVMLFSAHCARGCNRATAFLSIWRWEFFLFLLFNNNNYKKKKQGEYTRWTIPITTTTGTKENRKEVGFQAF